MTYRTRNILLAAGLALLAAVFMLIYVSKAGDDGGTTSRNLVKVLVAGQDIEPGTLGSSLTGDALRVREVPASVKVDDAITSRSQVQNMIATRTTLQDDQVRRTSFGPKAATGVLARVKERQRAIQIAGEPSQVLDGTLKAGDSVDVFGAWNVPAACATCKVARTIVRNAFVLAVADDLPSEGGLAGGSEKAIQLRLTDRQAERVFWMEENGKWWLVLRPAAGQKPKSSSPGVQNAGSILRAKAGK